MSASISSASDLLLEAVAEDFGNIQKDLGTDARVASLHTSKKTLVHYQYLDMVRSYARHHELEMKDDELTRGALEWAMTRGARSGRVAWQFIQDLAGRLGQRLQT